jgi:hypothetical protein
MLKAGGTGDAEHLAAPGVSKEGANARLEDQNADPDHA